MRRETMLPPIVVTAQDYDRLVDMASAAERTMPHVADYLMQELERAFLVDRRDVPATVVAMGSAVTFRDEQTKQSRRVKLVYPWEADMSEGRMSILTPVGAALLGLREGQSIRWYTRSGAAKMLTVLTVEPPLPSRSGSAGA